MLEASSTAAHAAACYFQSCSKAYTANTHSALRIEKNGATQNSHRSTWLHIYRQFETTFSAGRNVLTLRIPSHTLLRQWLRLLRFQPAERHSSSDGVKLKNRFFKTGLICRCFSYLKLKGKGECFVCSRFLRAPHIVTRILPSIIVTLCSTIVVLWYTSVPLSTCLCLPYCPKLVLLS